MSRTAKIALVVSGLATFCVVGVCVAAISLGSSLPVMFGCKDTDTPTVSSVVDKPQRVKELYRSY